VGDSAGSLRLASTDVRTNPVVRFNYFSNPTDLELCINGTRKIADVLNTRSMDEFKVHQWFGGREFRYVGASLPRDQRNQEQMGEFCRRTVSTIWHYHGGCLMGKVVDRNLRVVGVGGLHIYGVARHQSSGYSSHDGKVINSQFNSVCLQPLWIVFD